MKKILTSLGMIVFVAAVVAGGTGAFFSDTETSTGNVFTAGEIDLLVDNTSYGFDWNRPGIVDPVGAWGPNQNNSWGLRNLDGCGVDNNEPCLFFDFADLKPGDYGEDTISLHVQNDAWACMALTLTSTPDNGIVEPEGDAGDITDGATEGELQNYLEFVFWRDDGDNVLEEGESVIQSLSGLAKDIFTGAKLAIADSSTGLPLPAAENEADASYIGKGWCFGDLVVDPEIPAENVDGPTPGNTGFTCDPAGNHNVAQTDGISVDVTFEAVQARHNANFLCTPTTEPQVLVGAALADYVAPTECAATVDDSFVSPVAPNFNTIQAAIDDAETTAGETVCVLGGTYNEDVTVSKDITLAGAGAATTFIVGQTSGEAGAVVITADGATVQGFTITEATGGFAALRISGARTGVTVDSNTLNGATGGAALLTDGGQSNHVISNNVIVGGDAGQPIAYVNGLASVNVASNNVDFTNNTFSGSGSLALGQEAGASSISLNKFSATTGFTDVEDWGAGNLINQNNFNDAVNADVLHSENGNTGDTGTTNAENNWWGDANPADGDAGADVDFTPFAAVAFAQN